MNFTRSGISAPCFLYRDCGAPCFLRCGCRMYIVLCRTVLLVLCSVLEVAFEACCKKYLKNILQKFAD